MKIYPEQLLTESLSKIPEGHLITRILAAAINAVDPEEAVKNSLVRINANLLVADRHYDLSVIKSVHIIGFGKAGAPMAAATRDILKEKLGGSLLIVKEGHTSNLQGLNILEAGHPIPDERSLVSSQELLKFIRDVPLDELVICVISGGGSSLLTAPANGITLEDIQTFTHTLLANGASIQEINIIRKHIDLLKGGYLASLIAPRRLISLILSDVDGDPLDLIASGPTAPDTTTFQDATKVIEEYGLINVTPPSILNHLRNGIMGKVEETPKPGNSIFSNVQNLIIGSNKLAATTAEANAKIDGFNTLLLTTHLKGEASHIGRMIGAIARQLAESDYPIKSPACIIAGGETTVTLRGDGKGGRNLELALSTVNDIAGLNNIVIVTLSTDGGDGTTDAAGAVVTGDTKPRALAMNLDPGTFLKKNNSYNFFAPLGDLIKPGPTLTNVNDLVFIFSL